MGKIKSKTADSQDKLILKQEANIRRLEIITCILVAILVMLLFVGKFL